MYELTSDEVNKIECHPLQNNKAISIWQDTDGNYRGMMWKNNTLIQAREIDPQAVLMALLTHS